MTQTAERYGASVETAQELRLKVAISCRILGMLGLVRDTTGHVSARIPGTDEMWIRCRGGDEYGLIFTGLHNIRRVSFDGEGPGLGPDHAAPNETAIHGEIYRAKPEVQAVVHAHPPYALLCGITGLEFRPIIGAYDPSALNIALRGVPVFPRSVTVTNAALAAEMLAAMGERDVVLMRGHGITVTGRTVEQVTSQAIRFDSLAQIMWQVALSGRHAPDISQEDIAHFTREGRGGRIGGGRTWMSLPGVETWGWKQHVKLLQVSGIGLPDDTWAT
jgi:ribulose-5-phosphate 4-epimerase/fuculose-1-phosphate aldolase